jgi:hypothetical protein
VVKFVVSSDLGRPPGTVGHSVHDLVVHDSCHKSQSKCGEKHRDKSRKDSENESNETRCPAEVDVVKIFSSARISVLMMQGVQMSCPPQRTYTPQGTVQYKSMIRIDEKSTQRVTAQKTNQCKYNVHVCHPQPVKEAPKMLGTYSYVL